MPTIKQASAPGRIRHCPTISVRIHLIMAVSVAFMLVLGITGCALTNTHVVGLLRDLVFYLVVGAMLFPVAIYAHQKDSELVRDGIGFLFWARFVSFAISPCILSAARLNLPLKDIYFGGIDQALHVNVANIHAWSAVHWLGKACNFTYPLLPAYILASIVLPILAKDVRRPGIFLLANVFGLLLTLPLFTLLPAVGPWSLYHFPASVWQLGCQGKLMALRQSGPLVVTGFAGIIAFPSLHVFWAVVCAECLWGLKWLRIPVSIFSALMAASTMTTGWHYFTDLLAGLALAMLCVSLARAITNRFVYLPVQLEAFNQNLTDTVSVA